MKMAGEPCGVSTKKSIAPFVQPAVAGFTTGGHSSPSLKARGFLAGVINRKSRKKTPL
jgi:hypothetical protein